MSCTLKTLSNGYAVSSTALYNVNETVTYSCNQFYTISGNPVATCLDASGTWSTLPTCKLYVKDNGEVDVIIDIKTPFFNLI